MQQVQCFGVDFSLKDIALNKPNTLQVWNKFFTELPYITVMKTHELWHIESRLEYSVCKWKTFEDTRLHLIKRPLYRYDRT